MRAKSRRNKNTNFKDSAGLNYQMEYSFPDLEVKPEELRFDFAVFDDDGELPQFFN